MNPKIEIRNNRIEISGEALNKEQKRITVTTYLRIHEMDRIDTAISIINKELKSYLENDKI